MNCLHGFSGSGIHHHDQRDINWNNYGRLMSHKFCNLVKVGLSTEEVGKFNRGIKFGSIGIS
jgi:hypothetical protein